ncbi:phage major tail protein, TP901-1 family [Virgibacillus halodenitrificans]|uniref:phage major tail protein, TP901-1 family n=1 Tax=Virgibacillus halodenitrificans TaxID=1482 RepID=UPI001FB52510|nr:phage major tail protein, TP901-1 family [Virgibacillus halodenitrificans]MCJ0932922.1 phage major tail protein, TP901-1 family [Virgibacillus halodenitrificans]
MPRSGKKSLLLIQREDAVIGTDAFVLGQLTEHTHAKENELVDEQSKFGRILAYGNTSESFDITAWVETNDPGQLEIGSALDDEVRVKIWEVNTELNANGKHDAIFAYTLVESTEKSSPGDGFEEFSSTVQVEGKSQKGELPQLPPEVLEFAQYGFEEPGETGSIAVTSISVTPTTANISTGGTEQLTTTILPEGVSDKSVSYSSSDTSIATVSSSGLVTGEAAGTATITVTSNQDKTKTATCEVTVA